MTVVENITKKTEAWTEEFKKLIEEGPPKKFWLRSGQIVRFEQSKRILGLHFRRPFPGCDLVSVGPQVHPKVLVGFYSIPVFGKEAVVYATATLNPKDNFNREIAHELVMQRLRSPISNSREPGARFLFVSGEDKLLEIVRNIAAGGELHGRTDTVRYLVSRLHLKRYGQG